jgi:hypothetical protein
MRFDESHPKYSSYLKSSRSYRGVILNLTIDFERQMDEFIANYFVPDSKAKRIQLMEMLICDRMDFSKKTDAVKYMVRQICEREKWIYTREFPGLGSDLESVAANRNKFAHQLLGYPETEDELEFKIILVSFKNKIKRTGYKNEDIKVVTDTVFRCIRAIRRLTFYQTGTPGDF